MASGLPRCHLGRKTPERRRRTAGERTDTGFCLQVNVQLWLPVTGRHPTHRPITFSNEAGHLFMSNHLITTKDQSEAFFARWKILEFPNSRLRSGLPLDENLAQRIIEKELPGIAFWALERSPVIT